MEPIKMTRAEYEAKYGNAATSAAPIPSTPQTPVKMTRAQYEQKYNTSATTQPPKPDGILKSIVKAPLTMVARPFQAVAALGGVSDEAIDKFSKEKLGGFVAPTPDNLGEVKQDVGRAVQTVSYGMPGLASGGAVFGAGSSLEKGNDLLSKETATEALLSAGGAKLGGAVLNPVLKGVGRAIPQPIKTKATESLSKTFSKISNKTKGIDLLPQGYGSAINKIADKTENVINAPFKYSKKLIPATPEGLIQKELGGIGNTAGGKNFKKLNNGMSMEEYLVKSGNIDTPERTMIKEFEKAKQSQVMGEEAMKLVPGLHKNEYVEQAIKGLVDKERKIGIPGGDSKEILALANKYNQQGGLSFAETNRIKQLYEKNVKLDFLKERATDSIQRANRIDQGIRQWQRTTAKKGGYTNVEEIMKQTQRARMVANELYKKSLKSDATSGFNLFDAVLVAGGNPTGLGVAFARRLFGSSPVKRGLAKALADKPSIGMKIPKQEAMKDMFLSAPKPGTPKTTQKPITQKIKGGPTLFTSPKGKTSSVMQDAVDMASVDTKRAKAPKAGRNVARKVKIKEALEGNQPFVDPKTLKSIKMGTKPKIGDMYKGKPVIELGSSNPKVQSPKTPEKYIPEDQLPVIEFGKGKTNKQKGSTLTNAVAATGLLSAAGAGGAKLTDLYKEAKKYNGVVVKPNEKKVENKKDIRKGFINSENRGALARGEDLYKVKGVTGDLGKYQVKPQTLKDWSKPWLGKQYTPEEFINNPKAQEEFMNQFEAVVKAYELSPEDAAVVWHKGWGAIGDQRPREEKKKALRKHIEEQKKNPKVMEYVSEFMKGLNS